MVKNGTGSDAVARDITNDTLFFTLKARATDLDSDALKRCETGNGITHAVGTTGQATIRFESSAIPALPVGVPLFADVQCKAPGGEIFTLCQWKVIFLQDISLRTTIS
jgi:hypothetical protein